MSIPIITETGISEIGFGANDASGWQKRRTFCNNQDYKYSDAEVSTVIARLAAKIDDNQYKMYDSCLKSACQPASGSSEINGTVRAIAGGGKEFEIIWNKINNGDALEFRTSSNGLHCESLNLSEFGRTLLKATVLCSFDPDAEQGRFQIATNRGYWGADVCRHKHIAGVFHHTLRKPGLIDNSYPQPVTFGGGYRDVKFFAPPGYETIVRIDWWGNRVSTGTFPLGSSPLGPWGTLQFIAQNRTSDGGWEYVYQFRAIPEHDCGE